MNRRDIDDVYKNARIPKRSKYQLVSLALPESLLTKATQGLNGKATKRSDYFQEIFNKHLPKNTGNVSDSKRFQSVKDFRHDVGKWWQEFEPYMQEQLDFIYPDLKIVSVRMLKSEAGGLQQSWHTDFTKWNFPRFVGIISFDHGTKIMVKNEGNRNDEVVMIPKGYMMIFRGDLFHAGAAYEEENRRLYFKAIYCGCELEEDEKDSVGYNYVCEEVDGGCGARFNYLRQLENHKYHCVKWKNVVASKIGIRNILLNDLGETVAALNELKFTLTFSLRFLAISEYRFCCS